MGEGLDKVARSLLDLEPTAILDLFEVFPDIVKKPQTSYKIHNGSVFKKGVTWQGSDYMPIGMEIEGFEVNADGRVNRPKLKISNKDFFVTNLLRKNDDFKNARILRKRTFVKFLDDVNFDGGNPFGDSDSTAELSNQTYIVSQKSQENKLFVELELTSPLDLDNFEINSRRIMGKYCYWQYRGMGCQYKGIPIQKEDGKTFFDIDGNEIPIPNDFIYQNAQDEYDDSKQYTTGDVVFVTNNRVRISDPSNPLASRPLISYYLAKSDVRGLRPEENPTFWDKDGCNKKLSSCKLRFSESKTVSRFVGEKEVAKNIARLNGEGYYYFEPEDEQPLLSALSGEEWTFIINLPRWRGDQGYGGALLSTKNVSDSKYGGINLNLYYNNYVYSYLDGKNDKSRKTSETHSEPIIYRRKQGGTFGFYDPYTKTSRDYTLPGYYGSHQYFRVGGWNFNTTNYQSPRIDVESVCFWQTALTNEQIDSLYRPEINTNYLRPRPIEDFTNTSIVNNNLLGWWENPSTVINGFTNSAPNNNNNLIFQQGTNQFTTKAEFYTVAVNEEISTQEEVSNLPFGGFPGTDGFTFQRSK